MPNPIATALRAALALMEQLAHFIDAARGSPPSTFFGQLVGAGGWQQMLAEIEAARQAREALPAPFGREPDGTPRAAPAYDACRAFWEAAQREPHPDDPRKPLFSIHDYVGAGLAQGAAQLGQVPQTDWQAVEDAIVGLASTPWGRYWLSRDANAAMIGAEYQMRFLGCVVRPKSHNPDEGYTRSPA